MEGALGKQPSRVLESMQDGRASPQPAAGRGRSLHQAPDPSMLPFKGAAEEPHIYFK